MEDLSNYRKSYEKMELLESHIPKDPITLFKKWFHEIEESGNTEEVNAMTIATIGQDGFPKSRVVLLKQYTFEGFIFYTNYHSEKGKAIDRNPHVCLSFFWPSMERQIIIKGITSKIAPNLSDGYFESRPEGSKLSAIISPQSEVIENRDLLENNLKELEKEMVGKEIERPKNWGGYIVIPKEVEFWQGRSNRLHDRIRYQLQPDFSWKTERLAP